MQQCIFSLTAETLWWTPEFSEIRGAWTCSQEVPHKGPGWSYEVYAYWHLLFVSLCFFHAEARQGKCGRGVWSANSHSKGLCKSTLFLLKDNELSIENFNLSLKKTPFAGCISTGTAPTKSHSNCETKPYIKMSTAMSIYTVYIHSNIRYYYYIHTILLSYLKKTYLNIILYHCIDIFSSLSIRISNPPGFAAKYLE